MIFIVIILHSYQNCTVCTRVEHTALDKSNEAAKQSGQFGHGGHYRFFCSKLKEKKTKTPARCEHVAIHLLTFLHRILYTTAELHLVTLCVEHKVRCPKLCVTRCHLYATHYILMAT